jgi:hypothetical protein
MTMVMWQCQINGRFWRSRVRWLVPESGERNGPAGHHERVALALERLQQLRSGVVLEGDLRLIAREGLD